MTQERHSLLLPWLIFQGIVLLAFSYAYIYRCLEKLVQGNENSLKNILFIIPLGEYI